MNIKKIISLLLLPVIISSCSVKNEPDNRIYLLVGAYSDGTTPGISVYDFDIQTGDFEPVSELKEVINPSYLVISPDEKFVYSVNETGDGSVSAFTFDSTNGTLRFINQQSTEGGDPCYITVDKEQTAIITANYSGGNISVFPLGAQGDILELTQRIDFSLQSHLHTAVFSPDEKYLLATDLGEDCIYIFEFAKHRGTSYLKQYPEKTTRLEAGSGPRHLAFHPGQDKVYCINELSGKISVFDYQEGTLLPIQSIASDTTLGTKRKGSADIHLTPDGRFLYASNRLQADGIAIFSVDPEDGYLSTVDYQSTGLHPRNFSISPNGKYLLCANRDSNQIQIFEIDSQTGLLEDTGKTITLSRPVCLQWIRK